MRTFRLAVVLVAVAGGSCICVVSPGRADLTIFYTFDEMRCDDAGVDRIRVSLNGIDVDDGSVQEADCSTFSDGITVHALRPGRYDVDVEGIDFTGEVIYASYGLTMRVVDTASNEYDIDVPYLTGQLTLYWTFQGDPACLEVQEVRVTAVDPAGFVWDDSRYPCDFAGIIYDDVPAGVWSVTLDGIDATDRVVYSATDAAVTVFAGRTNEYTVDLVPGG